MVAIQRVVKKIEDGKGLDRLGGPLAGAAGRATRPRPVKNALSGTWLGHQLHPMLTDVPIGSWVSASVLDFTAGPSGSRAAQRLVGFGILAAVPTAAAGASDWSESYGAEQRVGLVHALGNVGALSLQVASYLARRQGKRGAGIALSTLGTGLAAAAGYLGGTLTFDQGVGVNHTVFEDSVGEWTDVAALAGLEVHTLVRVSPGGGLLDGSGWWPNGCRSAPRRFFVRCLRLTPTLTSRGRRPAFSAPGRSRRAGGWRR